MSEIPLTLDKLEKTTKQGSNVFLEKLKLLFNSLFLLESDNPQIDLNIILYVLSFKYLSTRSEDLNYISSSILQRGFNVNHDSEEILCCLMKEVGNSSISFKRWKDFFFIERVLFLLRKLEINVRK